MFNSYGENMPFANMGWTGVPGVLTTASGTGPANATMINAQGGSMQGSALPTASCSLCSNPTAQAVLFIVAILLIAIGWHLHLFSMIEG